MTKSKSVNWKKFLSILLVLMMTMSILAIPVSAARSSRSISTNKTQTVHVSTGTSLKYSLPWVKTTVTFKNTSKNGAITVQPLFGYNRSPRYVRQGQSVTFSLSGKNKTYNFNVWRNGLGSRNYRVTSSAGSIW